MGSTAQRRHHKNIDSSACSSQEDVVHNASHGVAVVLMRILLLCCQLRSGWQSNPYDIYTWWILIPQSTLMEWTSHDANTRSVNEATEVESIPHIAIDVTLHPLECLPIACPEKELIFSAVSVARASWHSSTCAYGRLVA